MSATTRTERSPAKPSPRPDLDPAYAGYVEVVSLVNGETCYFPPETAEELIKRKVMRRP